VPVFESSVELPCSAEVLFDFLVKPENLIKVSPPDLQVRLIEAPARIELGSRITVVGRRWGISQKMTTEVIRFDVGRVLADEQREGPFRAFRHTRVIHQTGSLVRLTETIEFEPPGGIIGMMMSASRIKEGLAEVSEYRGQAMRRHFDSGSER
jgi:ligand-binding SRPBCC domain-containing protein